MRDIKIDDQKREIVMRQNGFTLDAEFHCFFKEGYGMFLTNVDLPLDKIIHKDFYQELIMEGCQLVEGPAAPATDGKFYSEMAIYITNYKEILTKRRKKADSTLSTKHTLTSITNKFQRFINNYDMACLHGSFGIDVSTILDTAINNIYDYEKEIAKQYQGNQLYTIISHLKDNLTGNERCKNHIIYTLENNLFDQIFKEHYAENETVSNLAAKGLKLINDYGVVQEHTNLGINLANENDIAIESIQDFINIVNTYSIEERCAILSGIQQYYIDVKSPLPTSAVIIINSIRDTIFEEKFGKSLASLEQKQY